MATTLKSPPAGMTGAVRSLQWAIQDMNGSVEHFGQSHDHLRRAQNMMAWTTAIFGALLLSGLVWIANDIFHLKDQMMDSERRFDGIEAQMTALGTRLDDINFTIEQVGAELLASRGGAAPGATGPDVSVLSTPSTSASLQAAASPPLETTVLDAAAQPVQATPPAATEVVAAVPAAAPAPAAVVAAAPAAAPAAVVAAAPAAAPAPAAVVAAAPAAAPAPAAVVAAAPADGTVVPTVAPSPPAPRADLTPAELAQQSPVIVAAAPAAAPAPVAAAPAAAPAAVAPAAAAAPAEQVAAAAPAAAPAPAPAAAPAAAAAPAGDLSDDQLLSYNDEQVEPGDELLLLDESGNPQ